MVVGSEKVDKGGGEVQVFFVEPKNPKYILFWVWHETPPYSTDIFCSIMLEYSM